MFRNMELFDGLFNLIYAISSRQERSSEQKLFHEQRTFLMNCYGVNNGYALFCLNRSLG